jgi:4-hydroxy-2-oxoheptanedioate aldolase
VHGWADLLNVVHLLTAAGTTTLVRVPSLDPERIGHALDSGAHGVIVPFIESGSDARVAVRACRYPPRGERSWGPSRSTAFRSDRSAMADPLCVVMVETEHAIAAVSEIAAVDGITAVLVGARDLALTLDLDPLSRDSLHDRPRLHTLLATVASVCGERGIPAAAPTSTSDQTRELAELGYRWFVLPSDIQLMQSAARTSREELVGATVADPGPSELGAAGHRRIGLDRRNGEQ